MNSTAVRYCIIDAFCNASQYIRKAKVFDRKPEHRFELNK